MINLLELGRKRKADSLVLVALLAATGCSGYTQLWYSHERSASAVNKENGKNGGEIVLGAGSDVGDHQLKVGFHGDNLPDTSSSRTVTIDPDDYREGPPKDKYLFKEDLVTNTSERLTLDLSVSLEKKMFAISYSTNDVDWLQISGLVGTGLNFTFNVGNKTTYLGENKILTLPQLELDTTRWFGSASLELKVGKQPYLLIPIRADMRIYHTGEIDNILGIGYEAQWGEDKK